jgi:hypothetical protein
MNGKNRCFAVKPCSFMSAFRFEADMTAPLFHFAFRSQTGAAHAVELLRRSCAEGEAIANNSVRAMLYHQMDSVW